MLTIRAAAPLFNVSPMALLRRVQRARRRHPGAEPVALADGWRAVKFGWSWRIIAPAG